MNTAFHKKEGWRKAVNVHSVTLLFVASTVCCFLILAVRMYATRQPHFGFLLWNLFLAWIPFGFALQLKKITINKSGWKSLTVFFLWLLFFPNAPYILTDLFHLRRSADAPFWFDLILILSFAWTGLMLGFISLMEVQDFLEKKFKPFPCWCVVIFCLLLCGFGIYIGRFERWNSWDLITDPLSLLTDVSDRLIHPGQHPRTVGVTVLFSSFLSIQYVLLRSILQRKLQSLKNE